MKEWRSHVLRRGTPVQSGDGAGMVDGTGEYRLYVFAFRHWEPRDWLLGAKFQWGGYNEVLTRQGWRMGRLTLGAGRRQVTVRFRWVDELTRWSERFGVWETIRHAKDKRRRDR